jgi:hypothetical protein
MRQRAKDNRDRRKKIRRRRENRDYRRRVVGEQVVLANEGIAEIIQEEKEDR